MIASKLKNENEDTNPLISIMQRMEALEKLVEKNIEMNSKIHEENTKKYGTLEKLVEENEGRINKRLGALEKLHEKNVERVDCGEKCALDESCVSAFWSNSSDSECRFNQDKSTLVKFIPGELYYCKECQTTLDLVFEAEYSGVIKLANVAMNKKTQASSNADPSKAVDGDPNTWFSSEALNLTKEEEPWLMVDLGQRFLVAQIRIQVRTKPIHKTTGGYVQVCLVDDFDRKVNPCNQHSEILKVNRRLRAYSSIYDVKKVIMGRYVVIKKLEASVIEISELGVMSVIPIMSYECDSCLAESNTVCEDTGISPVCSCAENHLPVDGDARNGCKDPCLDFNEDNAVCDRVDHETRRCSCKAGYHPVREDACNGCNDPCDGFNDRNNVCLAVSFEHHSCKCKEGHFEIFKEDPCFGCLDPCDGFKEQNTLCSATDAMRYKCSCEQGYFPIHDNKPCQGCKRIVCPSNLGYKNYQDFGCLKVHKTSKKWEDARSSCISEGGDLLAPRDKLPILPKDEMNLGSNTYYWIGVRTNGNDPFEKVATGVELADDSQLWRPAEPERKGAECVLYISREGLLADYPCTNSIFFICQKK